MKDIRRRYHNSKSNESRGDIRVRRASLEAEKDFDTSEKAKIKQDYKGEISYTRDGRPLINASEHFDMRPPEREIRQRREDFDVLKRSEFFNTNAKTDFDEENLREFRKKRKKKKKSKLTIFYIFLFLILLGLGVWTFVFDTAKVYVSPKYEDISISGGFLIFKEDILIDYVSSKETQTVLKSAPKEVNEKASGELTIYNNYSGESQVLINNTRFQTADGKIFRINQSVTVPGKVGSVPGAITVKVYADTYGSEYNIGPSEFSIPGFKDTARYEAFYAKSNAPMTGGVSGIIQIVSEDDIESAKENLIPKIKATLKEEANYLKKEGYVTLYDNLVIDYTDNSSQLIIGDGNNYELEGVAAIVSIKEEVLAKLLAEQALGSSYNSLEKLRLEGEGGLAFEMDEDPDIEAGLIKFNIEGRVRLVWTYDADNIKVSLMGKKISSLSDIMQNYSSSVVSSTVKVMPTWSRTFPNTIERIKIIEEMN